MFLSLLPPPEQQICVGNLIKAHCLIMHHLSLLTFLSCVDFYNTGNGRQSPTLISGLVFKIYMLHLSVWKVIWMMCEVKYAEEEKSPTIAYGINVGKWDQYFYLHIFLSSGRKIAYTPCCVSGLRFIYCVPSGLFMKWLICEWWLFWFQY